MSTKDCKEDIFRPKWQHKNEVREGYVCVCVCVCLCMYVCVAKGRMIIRCVWCKEIVARWLLASETLLSSLPPLVSSSSSSSPPLALGGSRRKWIILSYISAFGCVFSLLSFFPFIFYPLFFSLSFFFLRGYLLYGDRWGCLGLMTFYFPLTGNWKGEGEGNREGREKM